MDLQRDAYKVRYRTTGREVAAKKLRSPIEKGEELDVRICFEYYKFFVKGENLQLIKNSSFPKIEPPKEGYTEVEDPLRKKILTALKIGPSDASTPKSTPKKKAAAENGEVAEADEKGKGKKKADAGSDEAAEGDGKGKEPASKKRGRAKEEKAATPSAETPKAKKAKATPSATPATESVAKKGKKAKTTSSATSESTPKRGRKPQTTSSAVTTPKAKKTKATKNTAARKVAARATARTRTSAKRATPRRNQRTPARYSPDPAQAVPSAAPSELAAGEFLAVRADEAGEIAVGRVLKKVALDGTPTQSIAISWLVEAREKGLRGCYAAPRWESQVEWGAVVQAGVDMRYDEDKDMYWLKDVNKIKTLL